MPSLFSWKEWDLGWAIIWVLLSVWFGVVTANVVELLRDQHGGGKKGKKR